MKKFLVPVICALVGCAAGVAMPAITAQSLVAQSFSTPPNVQPVQAFCERYSSISEMTEGVRLHGADGFHATVVTGTIFCFERPAQ